MITTFGDGLQLTDRFWDCECEENYIHPRNEDLCPHCGVRRDEQPDARIDEVKKLLGTPPDLICKG